MCVCVCAAKIICTAEFSAVLNLSGVTQVDELNITIMDDIITSSGSGMVPENSDSNTLQPDYNITQMDALPIIVGEVPGQLYAYRVSRSEVILGTRRKDELGSSIGISREGQGEYQCVARNSIVNSTHLITVNVIGTVTLSRVMYSHMCTCMCMGYDSTKTTKYMHLNSGSSFNSH